MRNQKQVRVGDLFVARDSLPGRQFRLQSSIFATSVVWMFREAFKHFESVGDPNLAMHHARIQREPDETALGHVTSGKRFTGKSPKPGMSTRMMFMVIPCKRDQDVDIQQIHASFLRRSVRDILGRNGLARVMHQDSVLAVGFGR